MSILPPTAGLTILSNEGEGMELPSDELIAEKWKEMPDLYKSRPRMANTLLNSEIEITGEEGRKVLTFKVTNVAQQKWIEEKLLRDIEINFQKITGSSGVVLRVGVVPDTEKKTELYTSQEKARFLMSNDLQVKNLITDLGLDTK